MRVGYTAWVPDPRTDPALFRLPSAGKENLPNNAPPGCLPGDGHPLLRGLVGSQHRRRHFVPFLPEGADLLRAMAGEGAGGRERPETRAAPGLQETFRARDDGSGPSYVYAEL